MHCSLGIFYPCHHQTRLIDNKSSPNDFHRYRYWWKNTFIKLKNITSNHEPYTLSFVTSRICRYLRNISKKKLKLTLFAVSDYSLGGWTNCCSHIENNKIFGYGSKEDNVVSHYCSFMDALNQIINLLSAVD